MSSDEISQYSINHLKRENSQGRYVGVPLPSSLQYWTPSTSMTRSPLHNTVCILCSALVNQDWRWSQSTSVVIDSTRPFFSYLVEFFFAGRRGRYSKKECIIHSDVRAISTSVGLTLIFRRPIHPVSTREVLWDGVHWSSEASLSWSSVS